MSSRLRILIAGFERRWNGDPLIVDLARLCRLFRRRTGLRMGLIVQVSTGICAHCRLLAHMLAFRSCLYCLPDHAAATPCNGPRTNTSAVHDRRDFEGVFQPALFRRGEPQQRLDECRFDRTVGAEHTDIQLARFFERHTQPPFDRSHGSHRHPRALVFF
jgi:hypothetical protein